MILRVTILIYLLSLPIKAAFGVTALPSAVAVELKESTSYQEGSQAMADLIHDVAVTKFRTALQDPDLSGTAKPYEQKKDMLQYICCVLYNRSAFPAKPNAIHDVAKW